MPLTSLDIIGFRNLEPLTLECSAELNVIIGANAAGKTSFLEAIYFLSRGRSFRTPRMRDMIRHSERSLQIVARVQGRYGSRPVVAGVAYDGVRSNARLDGEATRSLAQLTACVPVLLLNPDSHRLLDDGPRQRRRFLDWGLFHAEARFWNIWRRYQTALRQRNAALRTHQPQRILSAWDGELVTAAEQLDKLRQKFCQVLTLELQPLIDALLGSQSVNIEYQRGWSRERSLAEILHDEVMADRRQGHTRLGPHRADFKIFIDGESTAQRLSRGQQKLLVIALILTQARLYRLRHEYPCILLIDDLPAELDPDNRDRVIDCLTTQSIQLFITSINDMILKSAAWPDCRLFQMTHGHIQEVLQ
jgi:DNA replication and repair protein RecF